MTKPMTLQNIRNSGTAKAWPVDKHPNRHLFFINKLVEQYYQPMGADHESVRAARLHAIVAAAAHMDYGLSAIHLGRWL